MAMKAVVEAGVGGPVVLTSAAEDVEHEFPDSRVRQLVIEGRPADVTDLRITHWITIAFELDESEVEDSTAVARELLDRVVDGIAVSAGQEIRVYYWSERVLTPEGTRVRLRPTGIASQPPTPFDVLPLMRAPLTERHYRALRHLRHGLAHTSPEHRFTSLMLAVMILSTTFPDPPTTPRTCPKCGEQLGNLRPGDRARLMNLANVLGGWTAEQIDPLWDLRNTVMGHGRRSLTPQVALELLEAGFDTARLAYDCLNASLPGLNLPGPAPSWFMTDLYMLIASGDHAHESVIDVRVMPDGQEWIASWPSVGPQEFRAGSPWLAIEQARNYATLTMKHAPKPPQPETPEIVRVSILL